MVCYCTNNSRCPSHTSPKEVPAFSIGQLPDARSRDILPTEQTPVNNLQSKPATQKLILSSVPPAQLGLKVINPETQNVRVDVVAVHGLGAIPDITWKDKKSGVEWISNPEMLPKAVPEARIMRFGYDSLWLGKEPIRTRLSAIANKLLLALSRERGVRLFPQNLKLR
jgi:hypothetical protein